MRFDIHGNNLESGHCEVHPWVHQEYPCGVCMAERNQSERYRQDEARHYAELEAAHYAQMWADEAAPWFDPNHPVNTTAPRSAD
jgi:hypothetical protein